MIRLKYHAPGTPPGTLVPAEGALPGPCSINLIRYSENEFLEKECANFEELVGLIDPAQVNWINIDGLGDVETLQKLAAHFGIHRLAIEDVLNTTQRPKAEDFGDHFFIVSEMIYRDGPKNVSVEQLSVFLAATHVITIQEESGHDVFEQVRARLRSGRGYARRMKADYLAYALLDATVDQFFPLIETVGDTIEEIEDVLMEKPDRGTLKRLYECKRVLLQLRRAAWPQREIFNALIRDDSDLIAAPTKIFLRDCYDHSTQIIDILENYRDMAAGLMDVYLTSLGFRTNEIMRILTVVSVLFIPLTFFAGVYGMNFNTDHPLNMPELNWPFGYIFFWCVCVTSVAGMLLFFKKRKWL